MKKNLYSSIRTQLVLSVIWSLFLPVGVPTLVLGAVNGIVPLLVAGIVLAVLGFYGTALMWLRYSGLKSHMPVYCMIIEDGETDVLRMASTQGLSENDVIKSIVFLLKNRYIIGYTFDGRTTLTKKEMPKQTNNGVRANAKCPNCGAVLTSSDDKLICPYCGGTFGKN